MAEFGGLKPTDKGRTLLAKALTGVPLHFTRVACGDGVLPEGTNIYELNDLISHKKDLEIDSFKATESGVAKVTAVMTNRGLAEGMFIRELGLFANDPTEGEILYAYTNAGERPDYLPGEDGPDAVSYIINLVTIIDRAPNVTAIIKDGLVYVTHSELDERLANLFPAAPNGGVTAADIAAIWARLNSDSGNIMRPIDISLIKEMILGADTHDISYMLSSITGQLIWNDLHNKYSRDKVHIELFNKDGITISNHMKIPVEEVVTGSECIDVESTMGLEVGLEYLISDANGQEFVKITEILNNKRLRVAVPVTGTYSETETTLCLSNWDYDDDRDSGAVAQTGRVYQSRTLEMVYNSKTNSSIVIQRDMDSGVLKVERWSGTAWVVCTVTESSLLALKRDRKLDTYDLPYILNTPTTIRVTCMSGTVKVDWIVVKSLFSAAEAPKPRVNKTRSWSTPGTYTWTAPTGCTFVTVTAIAGGMGGTQQDVARSGEYVIGRAVNVIPGQSYTITIGRGGRTRFSSNNTTQNSDIFGGNTSFSNLITLTGAGGDMDPVPAIPPGRGIYPEICSPLYITPDQWIVYRFGANGTPGKIPGSRGGLAAMRSPYDINSITTATDGVRGGGGGGCVYRIGPGADDIWIQPGGNGGDGYLEITYQEEGSW